MIHLQAEAEVWPSNLHTHKHTDTRYANVAGENGKWPLHEMYSSLNAPQSRYRNHLQFDTFRVIIKSKARDPKYRRDNEEAFGIKNVLLLIVFNDPSKH